MLGRDVVITSADPVTGEPVTVTAGPDRSPSGNPAAQWYSSAAAAARPGRRVSCGALNFFTSAASARTWAREHPDVTGTVIGQARAEEIGGQTFGALLADD